MVVSSENLSMLGGAASHHLIIVDDSGSMEDRVGDETAFANGLDVVQSLIRQGARLQEVNTFSLILLSEPDQVVSNFSERPMDDALISDLDTVFGNLQCTHEALDLVAGLEAARRRFSTQESGAKYLHVVSDFRARDWNSSSRKAIAGAIEELEKEGVTVNLVRTVPERNENIAVTELGGHVQTAARGITSRLLVKLKNFGQAPIKNKSLDVYVDDEKLPFTVHVKQVEPGKEIESDFDVTFPTAGQHRVRIDLPGDTSFTPDNSRSLAVDVADYNDVLIVDGNPLARGSLDSSDAVFLGDLLNPEAPGKPSEFRAEVQDIDFIRRRSLDPYCTVILMNVGELPVDALEPLEAYVRKGGGLVWFMGSAVNPIFYNDALYKEGNGLFPVRLGLTPRTLEEQPPGEQTPDLQITDHPILNKLLGGQDNSLVGVVRVNKYFPVAEDWIRDDQKRGDDVITFLSLRNREPLGFEHSFGKGKIVTLLTTSEARWNNIALYPPVFILQYEMVKYVARSDRMFEKRTVGQPIEISLDPVLYTGKVVIEPPGEGGEDTIEAPRRKIKVGDEEVDRFVSTYGETGRPGIYRVSAVTTSESGPDSRLYAYNVPVEESDLQLIDTEEITKSLGEGSAVTIQEAGSEEWLEEAAKTVDQDVRYWLLVTLILLLVAEQALAYRLSYHPTTAGAAA
jgi:hypothetical protein